MKFKISVFIGLAVFSVAAQSAEPAIERLGVSSDWVAYQVDEGNSKVCYMASRPISSKGNYKRRGDVFLTVTHRPGDKTYDVVSFAAGYTYRKKGSPTLSVDKNKAISLFSSGEGAWAKDNATDRKLIQQMQKGSSAVIKGYSFRGTLTTDQFSLKGFSKAYDMINKACPKK